MSSRYLVVQLNTQRNLFQQYILPIKLLFVFIFGSLLIIILFIYWNINYEFEFNINKYLPEYAAYRQEAQSLCYLPVAAGSCNKQLKRFYFNWKINKCVNFIYT